MKLTIKEINESKKALHHDRAKFEKELHDQLTKDNAIYQQHLEDLRLDEKAALSKLTKNISKLFKGLKPQITVNKYELTIKLLDKTVLTHKYNEYSFNGIDKELADTAIKLYTDEFGDCEEEKGDKYIKTLGDEDEFIRFLKDYRGRVDKETLLYQFVAGGNGTHYDISTEERRENLLSRLKL